MSKPVSSNNSSSTSSNHDSRTTSSNDHVGKIHSKTEASIETNPEEFESIKKLKAESEEKASEWLKKQRAESKSHKEEYGFVPNGDSEEIKFGLLENIARNALKPSGQKIDNIPTEETTSFYDYNMIKIKYNELGYEIGASRTRGFVERRCFRLIQENKYDTNDRKFGFNILVASGFIYKEGEKDNQTVKDAALNNALDDMRSGKVSDQVAGWISEAVIEDLDYKPGYPSHVKMTDEKLQQVQKIKDFAQKILDSFGIPDHVQSFSISPRGAVAELLTSKENNHTGKAI